MERVELAAPTGGREICVSPGLATNLRFDAPAIVELQDEVRFEQVLRDRRLLTLMPPPDMAEGERLRLTVHFEGEPSPSGISLMLVGHSGQATHQVEVSRDERTRESLRRELLQERARTARLREALARAEARLHQSGGLRRLIINGALGSNAIQFHQFYQTNCRRRVMGEILTDFWELVRTHLLLLAQGWKDIDDADALREDAALRLAVSDSKSTGPLKPPPAWNVHRTLSARRFQGAVLGQAKPVVPGK